jgi:hypothetical protein
MQEQEPKRMQELNTGLKPHFRFEMQQRGTITGKWQAVTAQTAEITNKYIREKTKVLTHDKLGMSLAGFCVFMGDESDARKYARQINLSQKALYSKESQRQRMIMYFAVRVVKVEVTETEICIED